MRLRDLLPREHILVPLEAASLREALVHMLRHLAETGAIRREGGTLDRLVGERRLRDIVSIGDDVVLPHYRTEGVDRLVMALGVAAQPLSTHESGLEIQPRIVALILAPPEAATLYLQTVSTLARLLKETGVVERLLRAGSADEVLGLAELDHARVQPRLTVRDMMMASIESAPPDMPVRDAIDLMIRQRIRALPVVGEKGDVLGMVTERDLMRALLPQIPRAGGEVEVEAERAPQQKKVRDIMTRSVLCISEEMGLDEVASMMINKDVEQLPVVSEGHYTGLLSRGDIIRKLFARPQTWP